MNSVGVGSFLSQRAGELWVRAVSNGQVSAANEEHSLHIWTRKSSSFSLVDGAVVGALLGVAAVAGVYVREGVSYPLAALCITASVATGIAGARLLRQLGKH